MISLIYRIENKRNLSMKKKQTRRLREQIWGCQAEGEGCIGSFGLADVNYYI